MPQRIPLAMALATLLACAAPAGADGAHDGHTGRVDFRVDCAPAVRADFDHALALLHHMTYPEARTAFRAVAARDPDCAMAHWGIAMTLFQPLWPTRPTLADRTLGWEEVRKARALHPASARDKGFIDSAAAFFEDPASEDYWARIRRWETSMAQLHAALPKDDDVAALYALAILATTPADRIDRTHADRAAALLLPILSHNPEHPGAMHYLVHANDVPGRERESLDITRRYERVAPDNPHALHMPTHVYTRLGDWDGVVRGNLRAADAALKVPAGDKGQYVWDEFPHAIEYLAYAYLQQGRDAQAAAQRDRLWSTEHLQPSFKSAFHLASTQARYVLERRDWKAAAAIEPRQPGWVEWDKYAWPEAISHFAHGMGAAHLGHVDDANASLTRMRALQQKMATAKEAAFERNIHMLCFELESAIANANGHPKEAIGKLKAAAQLEATTPKPPVTPAPTLPADELLGDLYASLDRKEEARDAYRRTLAHYPNRRHAMQALE
jgi:tetratricopeptide (TPR) repeat protein